MTEALDIEVHGIVQGVGFRPFVYNLARKYALKGWVLNATAGVFIHAEGEPHDIDSFVIEISEHSPAAARVDEILMHEAPLEDFADFSIRYSDDAAAAATTLVSPDLATCDDCFRELFDPSDRRYHYPFINCTNCGPRFTIIEGLPYDRPKTSMKRFEMCEACAAEYANPEDRRFHAQPDACFECGPWISWRDSLDVDKSNVIWGDTRERSDEIIDLVVSALRRGQIAAIKGLGGFHLACDASNEKAIAELRRRKRREGKAFAVMMPNMAHVLDYCEVNDAEERLLNSPQHPIVLLKKKPGARFAPGLADALPELGVMLPYTPLQHLLLSAFGGPLVMTSGNIHDEPIQTDDDEAWEALHEVADVFLGNNRPILCRFDDSVVRVIKAGSAGEAIQSVRRARGYAPLPVKIKRSEGSSPTIIAAGPEQKSTFTLLRGEDAFVSQHIGDMENAATFDAWLDAKAHYEKLFDAQPEALACDMHPEYLATKWAHEESAKRGLPLIEVQHHHAHIAAVMAENDLDEAVIGVAFDGTGYGADGSIWGGEVLLANRSDFERFANFAYVPMPGGAACIKRPLRMAYGLLWEFDLLDHPAAAFVTDELGQAEADLCAQMIERGLNTPMTSSVGRLFDAMSALLGICTQPAYEGEAAILLEAAIDSDYDSTQAGEPYQIGLIKNTADQNSTAHDTSVVLFDAEPLVRGVLDDMAANVPRGIIAGKIHDAFVGAIALICQVANAAYGITTVALAGGVFMNRYLVEHATAALEVIGFTVALNKELPPNDGSISYGQAAIAAKRLEESEQPCA
ncbi:carbamoyltransferase HypF [uncultured Slackia sp.]|uniref:carbamoyltransferase HypF n=1 Tax=uncultured Slackia sp. TaxID=665903 RepID=UPI0025F50A14|nr:carbamoyltransferase HypF [uncultured Slackia sp.]